MPSMCTQRGDGRTSVGTDRFHDRVNRFGAPAVNNDRGTFGADATGDRFAEAADGARDHGPVSGEFQVHRFEAPHLERAPSNTCADCGCDESVDRRQSELATASDPEVANEQ
jgi:hypothetical protein